MNMPPKTNRDLRKFGITMACAFAIFGALFLWREKPIWPWLFGISGIFLIFSLLLPQILKPVEWAWMKMAHFLGQVMTRVILTIAFYLVITPLGLIRRIFGKAPLNLKFDKEMTSYWIPVDPDGPTSRPEKPY